MDPKPAAPTRLPRLRLRLLASVILAPVVAALALLLSAPLWIDAPRVHARIVALAGELSGGRARWDSLELHYLPRPRATLRQVSFDMPPRVAFEARAVTVELELLPLLRGEVRSGRAVLASPRLRMQLPPSDPASPPRTVDGMRAAVRGALEALFEKVPSAHVEVSDGEVDLRTQSGIALRFTAIALQGRIADDRLEASGSASSPLFDRLALEADLRKPDFAGTGRATLTGLHLGALATLFPSAGLRPDPADATAELSLRLKGLEDLGADLGLAVPALAASRGAGRLELEGLTLEARARLRGGTFELDLARAALAQPLLESRGRLAYAPGAGWRAALELARADLGQIQAAATRFLPEVATLSTPPVRIGQGSIASLTLEAAAPVLADLATLPALRADARVEGATVVIAAAAALEARDVGAHASLEGGTLRVDGLAARTAAGELTGGRFDLKLDARPVTLDGFATARVDLAGAAASAARLLDPAGGAALELRRLHDLQGSARVRVELAGDAQRPRPRVEVSDLRATARHDLLPLPLAITAGAITFAEAKLALGGLSGSVGRSTLREAGARLRLGAAPTLESASGSAEIDLAEVLDVARARPGLAGRLEGVRAVTGRLAVRVENAAGPLSDPRAIGYAVSATPRKVSLDLPALGPALLVDEGAVRLTPDAVAAKDVGVALLDAALRVGGSMPLERRPRAVPRVTASGTLGPRILEWIHARAALPETALLRDPVLLQAVSLDWRGGGDFATRGSARIGTGPTIGFDVRRSGARIEVGSLTVRDAHSDGRLDGSLDGTRFAVRFAGHLAGRSFAGLLRRADLDDAVLRGDLQVTGNRAEPGQARVEGSLEASGVSLASGMEQPLVIERARLDGRGETVRIPEAILALGPSTVRLEGEVRRSPGKLLVDARISGDAVDVPWKAKGTAPPTEATGSAGDGRSGGGRASSALDGFLTTLDQLPVAGRLRVDIARLRAGTLEIAPLRASAVLEEGRLRVEIDKVAVCAVALSGRFSAQRGSIDAEGMLSARGAPLETTLPCLGGENLKATGRLDLDGRFSVRGAPETLATRLKASVQAVSRDGRIDRFPALVRVLRLVNLAEVARGAITELGSAGMAYRSASVGARVDNGVVTIEEGILDAEGIKIVVEGTIGLRDGALGVNVLAAPMQTANWLVDKIPLVRRILGGAVLAVPARVNGTLGDPLVVPLGARAVGSRMLGILANTARLPTDLVKALELPAGDRPSTGGNDPGPSPQGP